MSLVDEIAEIDDLLQQVQEKKKGKIDGTVLSTLLTLLYKCGLHLNEVGEIRIEDLNYNDNNELRDITITGSTPIPIPEEVRGPLQDYLAYLRDKGYPAIPRSRLFPKYNDTKKIARHLEKFSKKIGVNEIRKVGIKRHWYLMKQQGLRDNAAIQATAYQFRMTERSVDQSIKGRIQPAGRPKPTEKEVKLNDIFNSLDDAVLLGSHKKAKDVVMQFIDRINNQKIFSKNEIFELIRIFFSNLEEQLKRPPEEAADKETIRNRKNLTWREKINLLSEYKDLHDNHTEFIELSNDKQNVAENDPNKSDDEV
jgi:hypothetical protein